MLLVAVAKAQHVVLDIDQFRTQPQTVAAEAGEQCFVQVPAMKPDEWLAPALDDCLGPEVGKNGAVRAPQRATHPRHAVGVHKLVQTQRPQRSDAVWPDREPGAER